MFMLTRGQMADVRLGCLGGLLLRHICEDPVNAYPHTLYAKLVRAIGTEYSKSDVSRALRMLAERDLLERDVEDPGKPGSRVFYRLNWNSGFCMAMLTPRSSWPSFAQATHPQD